MSSENQKPPLWNALHPKEDVKEVVDLADGTRCTLGDLTFNSSHIYLIPHLAFLQRLRDQQQMKISDVEMIDLAIKLMNSNHSFDLSLAVDDIKEQLVSGSLSTLVELASQHLRLEYQERQRHVPQAFKPLPPDQVGYAYRNSAETFNEISQDSIRHE